MTNPPRYIDVRITPETFDAAGDRCPLATSLAAIDPGYRVTCGGLLLESGGTMVSYRPRDKATRDAMKMLEKGKLPPWSRTMRFELHMVVTEHTAKAVRNMRIAAGELALEPYDLD